MKRISLLLIIVIFSCKTYSQKNIYQFGVGINTIDPLNSQVVSLDYSHSLKNKRWRIGGVFQCANSNFFKDINNVDTVRHSFTRGKMFTYNELLTHHENELGLVKLKSVTHYEQDMYLGPYIGYQWNRKKLIYSIAFGVGMIKYTLRGQGSDAEAKISLDSAKTGRLITPYIVSGYSISAYTDFRFAYCFNNRLMVGTKVSFDYDILDYGGFPLKNTIFIGIKF